MKLIGLSLGIAGVSGVLVAGASWAALRGMGIELGASHLLAVGGSCFGLLSLVLTPAAIMTQRELERLTAHVSNHDERPSEEGYRAPLWIRPVADAIHATSRNWASRLESAQVRLREAEIRYSVAEAERRSCESILHSLRDGVIVTDPFNELTLANEPAARLLGFDLEESSHRSIDDILDDASLRDLIDQVRQSSVNNKQKHVEHTIEPDAEHADGGVFDVTLTCLAEEGNGNGRVVTILRDVTKEKEISQMKSDFVSQASHELRTPLSSINAYIEMLIDAEAEDEETRQEFYGVIKQETDRVSRMIDNMLNISKIESGIVQAEIEEVDFVKLTKEVLDTMRPQAALKRITLHEKSGPLLYTAAADRDMIHQVLVNLIGNAIKYTPEGGRATVTVENDDTTRSVLVTVSDTGLGIPPDAIENIFSKFYRIESYKRVAKGTGLGLNLVKHIVETVHGGHVGVDSEVGMGSRFWFSIPYECNNG